MMNTTKARRFAALLLTVLLGLSLCGPALSAVRSTPVRVGFFAFDGYHMQDENGVQSGYGYDLVQYMSGYTDLQFIFVGYDKSWSEAQEMLANGEIDMLTSAQKTPARLERFDFSDHPIGTSSAILTVKAGNTAYILGDYANWNGMRVGMLRDNSRNDRFMEFAVERGFTYTAVYYDDTAAMLAALQTGRDIDTVITSNLRRIQGEWILAQFDPSPFYIMVQKGNTALLSQINAALAELYAAMPDIDALLLNKYYLTDEGGNIAFTLEENALIEQSEARPVNIGVILSGKPVCYTDESGDYVGISMDILRTISRKTGLVFNYVPIPPGTVPFDEMKAGRIDLAAGIVKTAGLMADPAVVLSDDVMADSLAVVARKNDDFTADAADKVIAMPVGFPSGLDYVQTLFPEHAVTIHPDFEACLKAVANGAADATVYFHNRAVYTLMDPHYEKLTVIPAYGMEFSYCIAGLAPEREDLIHIIDKGVFMITEAERSAILLNYTVLNAYQLSFWDFLYKYHTSVIIITILLLIILAAVIAFFSARRRNAKKLRTAYEQTKDALAQAEAATKAKSEFLASMSHDIRTPMNAIVGFTEIARQHKDDPERMEDCLSKIDVSSRMLLHIINDVLDMSAIESGKLKIHEAAFDIKQVLTAISTIYYPQCQAKGVAFRMETDLEEEHFLGDALRLEQILMNLVSNAYKFTERGDTVIVRTEEVERRGSTAFLRFTVTDTGCGMEADMHERMFRPFEQESADTARKHGGSGLGLSIVKNLVDLMHGAIRVESEPGKGTTFAVDLPMERDESGESSASDSLRALRILCVDDDAAALEYTSIVLQRIGVPFAIASSGEQALAMIAAANAAGQPYHACLIDWKMQGMDGVELTRRIREAEKERILIIIVSAFNLSEVEETARIAGADHFIAKPLFQSTVFNTLMRLSGGGLVASSARPEGYDFTGRRVLLAEDNELNAEIATEILGLVNLSVDHAADGEAAVARFCESTPGTYDLILMDIQMPLMDGYAATLAIRALERPDARDIPILAMTANAFTDDIAAALSAGMNGHIAKPIDTELLYETLAKYLRQS